MAKIELLNCDCMDFMRTVPDKAFDLAIVDPPYGIKDDGRNHLGRVFNKDGSAILKRDNRNGSIIKIKKQDYKLNSGYDNEQPNQIYFDELFRVTSKVIIFGENYILFNQKDKSSGRIIWDKVNGETDQSDCELAWTNCHKSIRMFSFMWNGMLQGQNGLPKINNGNKSKCEKRIHPNHKPVALYKWILNKYATNEDKIIDTHAGSFSHAIAAYDLGFDLTIMEIDKDYYEAGKARYDAHVAKYSPATEIPVTSKGELKLF